MKTNIVGIFFILLSVFLVTVSFIYTLRFLDRHQSPSLVVAAVSLILAVLFVILGSSLIRRQPWAAQTAITILIPSLSATVMLTIQEQTWFLAPLVILESVFLYFLKSDQNPQLSLPVVSSTSIPPPTPPKPKAPFVTKIPIITPNNSGSSFFLNPFGTIKDPKKAVS